MNRKKYFIILTLFMMTIYLTACGKKDENPYGLAVSSLCDNDAYAFLVMDYQYNVMVTSDMLYDAGTEKQASAYCDVYYYLEGEAKKLGTVMSNGTAYPVSFSKDGIFAVSGHSIEKYAVSAKDGALYLAKGVYETFDESGNAYYTCVQGGEETESTEQDFLDLAEEYASSQIIHFAYGAADCLNEIEE